MAKNKKGNERRIAANVTLDIPKLTLSDRLSILLAGFQLSDIISTKNHSEDFTDTRTHFILGRLKLMAYIFAILVPLSFIIDVIMLDPQQVQKMFYARVILTCSLVVLALFCRKRNAGKTLKYLLPICFLLPVAFNVATQFILEQQGGTVEMVGYSFMPYLIVAMLALFPLTIAYSLYVIALVFVPFLLVESYLGEMFTLAMLNKVWAFAMFASVTLWLQIGQLVMLLKLYRESTLDPLTGLINRRVLMKRLEKEISHGNNFFILMFDLDKFKRINDTYGHLDGDLVLKTMSQIIKKEMRDNDIVARFGGEEFVAVLSGLTTPDAISIAERIRAACEACTITNKNGDIIEVTTSIGVTEHKVADTLEVTFNRADELLYQAKSEGRNRVMHD